MLKNVIQSIVLSLAILFSASAYSAKDALTTIEDGKLSIQAKDVLLNEILDELYEKTKFRLLEYVSTEEKLVEVDIEALPWEKAIAKLLVGWDYTLTMDAETTMPKILIISGKHGNAETEVAPIDDSESENNSAEVIASDQGDEEQLGGQTAEDIEAEIRAAAEVLLAPVDHTAEALAALEAAQQALREAYVAEQQIESETGEPSEELLQSQQQYLDSLSHLGDFDDTRVVDALVSPLSEDALPEARLTALRSLSGLSATQDNPIAVDKAFSIATTTQDAHEQRAALEIIVRYADPEDVLPVVERLALSEGKNRDLAVREWLRIKEEQAEQLRIDRDGDPQLDQGN